MRFTSHPFLPGLKNLEGTVHREASCEVVWSFSCSSCSAPVGCGTAAADRDRGYDRKIYYKMQDFLAVLIYFMAV